jgi:hypothetical protein
MDNQPSKNEKRKMQIKQQFFHLLMEIAELYPDYTISQHLSGILRRKSSESKEFYFWSNEELLKRVEKYKEELDTEESMTVLGEEDY